MNRRNLILFFILSVAFSAQAGRKVSIPSEGSLKLTNPSAVAVSFDLVCKSAAGSTILNQTGQTLAAGATSTFGYVPGQECANGASPSTPSGTQPLNGMKSCALPGMNFIPVTQAATLCGQGYHLCTISEYAANRNGAYVYGTLSPGSGTWSAWIYNGTEYEWQDLTGTTDRTPSAGGMSNEKCSPSAGGASPVDYCNAYSTMDPMSPTNPVSTISALCCPNTVGHFAHCTVEIHTVGGHLISPQFMGGKAF